MVIKRKIWLFYFAAGAAALFLYFLPLLQDQKNSLMVAFSASSAVAIYLGIGFNRPYPVIAWFLFGVGQTFNFLGDLTALKLVYWLPVDLAAAVCGWFYILGMGCFLTGLVFVMVRYRQLIDRDAITDGAIVALPLCVMVWLFQIAPSIGSQDLDWMRSVLFPASTLLILSAGSIFLLTSVGSSRSYHLMFTSVLLNTFGLAFYSEMNSAPGFLFQATQAGVQYFYEIVYSVFYLALGAALLHPSSTAFHGYTDRTFGPGPKLRLRILGAAFFLLPFTFWLQNLLGRPVDTLFIVISISALFGLILFRVFTIMDRILLELSQERRKANNDLLTGLPNRTFLYRYLPAIMGHAERNGTLGAVFMMDLNHFKDVNDLFGHDRGDLVLQALSQQFLALQGRGSLVARLGGDEFVFVLEQVEDQAEAKTFALRMSREVQHTVSIDGRNVTVSVSVGMAMFPTDGRDIDSILKKADIALYQAKRQGQVEK